MIHAVLPSFSRLRGVLPVCVHFPAAQFAAALTVSLVLLAAGEAHARGPVEVPVGESSIAAATDAGDDPAGPDVPGLRRDTIYLVSYQFVSLGILIMAPESISGWSDEQKEKYTVSTWWENVRNPAWDHDEHWLNYLAHPYWGASYYVRSRERGFDERASFWYATVMSSAYEFGAEALFEQPSLQDIFVTPIGGAIVGEYFMHLRARTLDRYAPGEEMRFLDRTLMALTDPLGAINRQVQGWLGKDAEAIVAPSFGPQRLGTRVPYEENHVETDWVVGLRFSYRW